MSNKKIAVAMSVMTVILTMGCYKVTTLDMRADLITGDVSFADDVLPILNESCATSGCHVSGAQAPDLSAGNAFNALSNGGYLDVSNPESSVLYEWVSGKRTPAMPISGADPTISATILAWISQGAQNN
ncbi:MAG: hypothetical protein HY842_16655 [Bacteroidetes bacterium]|nr:hypothetical protein [Bacteroidota bacterium]